MSGNEPGRRPAFRYFRSEAEALDDVRRRAERLRQRLARDCLALQVNFERFVEARLEEARVQLGLPPLDYNVNPDPHRSEGKPREDPRSEAVDPELGGSGNNPHRTSTDETEQSNDV